MSRPHPSDGKRRPTGVKEGVGGAIDGLDAGAVFAQSAPRVGPV